LSLAVVVGMEQLRHAVEEWLHPPLVEVQQRVYTHS